MIMISVIEKEYMETVIRMGKRLNRHEIDWEQRRYEIAKEALAAIISNPDTARLFALSPNASEQVPPASARLALTFAEALVAELQKPKEETESEPKSETEPEKR